MGVMNTGSFAKALYPGVKKWFGDEYARTPMQYTEIFDVQNSTRAYEEIAQAVGFGLMPVKPEGAAISYDERKQGFITRFTHATYAMGFIVTEEAIEDDQYDVVAPRRARALANSVRITKETVGANVLNRAFNSTYTGGDGKELCATDHPNFSGGTWSNELATAADLSEASLEQLCINIRQATDDRGLRIALMPQALIVPSDLAFEAERILRSTQQSGTANNDVNALRSMGVIPRIIVNDYLTDADAWFVKTDAPDGMICFNRKDVKFEIDNDFDTSNAKFKASFRKSFGWGDPRGIYGSPGA